MTPMIEVCDLSVSFERVRAVQAVSFAVPAGGSFGLVGESGSGKSTVLRALCGLLHHWQGAIRIDGEAQGPRRSKAFYKRVQMVFQDPYGSLHPRHTVDTLLAEPIAIHHLGHRAARIERALTAVGLDHRLRFRYPHQLSGGQRQRVAIARALILEPRVLLLDEPTSALDVSVQAEVLNMLKSLQRELGLTYLLVSHDLAVVAHLCDELLVMHNGAAVETLSVAQLATRTPTQPYTQALLAATQGYAAQPLHREDRT